MSSRYTGPKLSDLDIKRVAHRQLGKYFYLNKGRFEYIDIIEILEFKLGIFAPGYKMEIVEDNHESLYSEDNDSYSLASTDPKLRIIFVSLRLYKDGYSGDAWSRYLLAHELGHAILHSDYTDRTSHFAFAYEPTIRSVDETKIRGIPLFRDSERQADLFSDFFLIPDDFLLKFPDTKDLAEFAKVEIRSSCARLLFYSDELAGRNPIYSSRVR
jgi:hypothetical protein